VEELEHRTNQVATTKGTAEGEVRNTNIRAKGENRWRRTNKGLGER